MNPYLKTAIWVGIGLILLTHPTIITTILNSLGTFAATLKQGGY